VKTQKLWLVVLLFVLSCTFNGFASPFGEESISIDQSPEITETEEMQEALVNEYIERVVSDEKENNDYVDLLQSLATRTNFDAPKSPDAEKVAGTKNLEDIENMPKVQIDGRNSCGQFAMTLVLNSMGIETDGNEIFQDSNPASIFTAPSTLVTELQERGVNATQKHNASIDDIKAKIDAGKPVITLVDCGDNCPHWICITGYDTDEEGNITSIRMRDAYWGTKSVEQMDIEEFKQRWAKPLGTGALGAFTRYKNLMIDIDGTRDPNNPSLFPNNIFTSTEDNIGGALNDIVTGWKNKKVGSVLGGVTKIVTGLPSAVVGIASNFVGNQSDKLLELGKKKFGEKGLGNKIIGGVSMATALNAKAVSVVGKTIANIGSNTATVLGNGVKKLFSLF
jgi:hypothetical protein